MGICTDKTRGYYGSATAGLEGTRKWGCSLGNETSNWQGMALLLRIFVVAKGNMKETSIGSSNHWLLDSYGASIQEQTRMPFCTCQSSDLRVPPGKVIWGTSS
jgi:hypothetical protein